MHDVLILALFTVCWAFTHVLLCACDSCCMPVTSSQAFCRYGVCANLGTLMLLIKLTPKDVVFSFPFLLSVQLL
jgi:hypothetical protein